MPRSTPIAVLLLVVAGLLGAGDAFAKQASGRSPLELAQAVERRAAAEHITPPSQGWRPLQCAAQAFQGCGQGSR